jgi:hypothetical protein
MHRPPGATPGDRDNRVPAVPHLLRGNTGALQLLCLLAALLLMAACGQSGSSSSNRPVSPPSITVSCDTQWIHVGQTSRCTATLTGTGRDSWTVNWSVNGVPGGNSTVGTISSSGLYTAPSSVPKATNFSVAARVGTLFNGSFAGTAITVSP